MNSPLIRLVAVAVGVLLLAAGCSSDESSALDLLPLPLGMAVNENRADEGCAGFEGDGGASGVSDTSSLDDDKEAEDGVAHVFVGRMYFPVTSGAVPRSVSVRVYAEPLSVEPSSYQRERDFIEGDFKLELRSGGVGVFEQRFRVDRPVFFREDRPVWGRIPWPDTVWDGDVLPVLEPTVFAVRVAEPPVYDSFAVSWAGRELFEAERSSSAPSVEVLGIQEGQVFNAWNDVDLCLDGVDSDGDRLSYRVYYSTNSGDTYRLYTDYSSYPYAEWQDFDSPRVRIRLLGFLTNPYGGGGFTGRVAVAVSDGFLSRFVESPAFRVPRSVRGSVSFLNLGSFGSSRVFFEDEKVLLEAESNSRLGDDVRYSWHSSLEGDLEEGSRVELGAGELTVGKHVITVTAVDQTTGLADWSNRLIDITPEGVPLVAVDDLVHLRPHESFYIRVLDNDIGEADYSLKVTVPAELGTVEASEYVPSDYPDPVVVYVGRVSGYDSFEYEVCDRDSFCDTAVVRVGVGVADCTIWGKDGDDHLIGTPGDDVICGLGGDDIIEGGGGDDIIRAGAGDDTIFGGSGNDYIQGETGDDTIRGDTGDDLILGGEGSDTLYGGPGYDILGGGNSIIRQEPGDQLYHTSAPTPAAYTELTSEEIELIDTAVRICEDATSSYTSQQNICAQTTASLCQTTTTANSRDRNFGPQRTAIASFVCKASDLTQTIAYEPKCAEVRSFSQCDLESMDFRDALKRDAQALYTPLAENTRQITEETLNKLRQLAEAIHEFAITIYRDQPQFYH